MPKRFTTALLFLLAAGCRGSDATGPRGVVGDYSMTTLAGGALPYTFAPDSAIGAAGDTDVGTWTYTAAVVHLRAGGRIESDLDALWTAYSSSNPSAPQTSALYTRTTGRWEEAGSRVRTIIDSVGYLPGALIALSAPDTEYFDKGSGGELRGLLYYQHGGLAAVASPAVTYPTVYTRQLMLR